MKQIHETKFAYYDLMSPSERRYVLDRELRRLIRDTNYTLKIRRDLTALNRLALIRSVIHFRTVLDLSRVVGRINRNAK